jgi:DNA repair photolyase
MTDLRDALLGLLAPLARGDELLPGVRLLRASTEAGLRLVFDADGEDIDVEIAPWDSDAPAAAATARLRFSYIARGPAGRERGLSLCRAVARLAGANEERLLADLARDAAEDATTSRIRTVRVAHLLEQASDGPLRFHTLTPYVGCVIGCRFCYAQSHVAFARRFEGRPVVPWGSYVDVRENAAEVLAVELEEQEVVVVKLCPIVSDPYQAAEERFGVTRACLEVLERAPRPPRTVVLTRSRLVLRDAALLGRMGAYVGVSIPTVDDEARAHFEPRAASVGERLSALAALRAAGATTFAVVQPLLPGPVEALADALAEHCGSVRIGVLTGLEGATEDFADPRFRHAASPAWQAEQAQALGQGLTSRGVALWTGELPPDLVTRAASPRTRGHARS